MKFRTNLRYRVTLSFALLGMVVSLGLAGVIFKLTIEMEERLLTETLSVELEDYIKRYQADPNSPPPTSTAISTYIIQPDKMNAPSALKELNSGLHHIKMEGKSYFAEVKVIDQYQFIVLFDDKQIRHREDQFKLFLGIGVFIMTIVSALLGLWLAGRVISPVRELASRVAGLRPEEYKAPLAKAFPSDEVGILAQDFDAYLQRLAAFIEREQSFTADVSHELRTPLAVIEGAIEVLMGDPEIKETQRPRLERIARSVREMTELVSALLLLSREEEDNVSESGCVVSELLNQVIEGHKHLLEHKPVVINLNIMTQTTLPVECTLLRIVIANLVRNAIYYTEQGQVIIHLDEEGISIKDTGIGIPKEKIKHVFERYYIGPTGSEGIGLSLVKRICRRYGWRIEIDSLEGRGTTFQLLFR